MNKHQLNEILNLHKLLLKEQKAETVEVAAVPAAALPPKTLHDELSEVLTKHGFDLTFVGRIPGKNGESVAHFCKKRAGSD